MMDSDAVFILSDEQWLLIEPRLPTSAHHLRQDDRKIISGIIYLGMSGCRWPDIPKYYGPQSTIYNRYKAWRHRRFWKDIIAAFVVRGWLKEAAAMDPVTVLHTRPSHRGRRIDRLWRPAYQQQSLS